MSERESAQRYRAELHTFAGRHSERCFNNIDDAHAWILAGYAELLRSRLVELIAEGGPDDYPVPVATTLRLSYERMAREHPAAAMLLRLCAFLAPDDIPIGLLLLKP